MMYKHWKKVLLALTAFFWNACDDSSTPTAPSTGTESSSGGNEASLSSAAADGISSSASVQSSSAAENVVPSSSGERAVSSSAVANAASSSTENVAPSSAAEKSSSSSAVKPGSSSAKGKISSSSLDQNVDLYGCPSDICGQALSSSSRGMIAPKYGVPIMSSSSRDYEAVPLYGVTSSVCVKAEGDSTLSCSGGLTCVETQQDSTALPSCSGDQICAKYGVVIIKNQVYKCDDGKVYNEAEFKARYDIMTVVENVGKKVPCYKRGDSMECDDGESFEISKDGKGNVIYRNKTVDLSEKEFLKKYEVLDMAPALYGPPCMFNGTCDEEK